MKKWTLALVSVLLTLTLLVGCAPASTPKTDVATTNTTTDATIATTTGAQSASFAPEEQLIKELIQFMRLSESGTTKKLSYKIDRLREGRQALYVKFSATSYYFVCAYAENASCDLSDPDQCTWVAFRTERAIPETYQGRQFICAFQINRAEHCWDIADEAKTAVPLEHYKKYLTHFQNGYNTYSARVFEETFIYSKMDDQYCSVDHPDHEKYDIPCVEINGQPFILQKVELKDTQLDTTSLKNELGKYYGCFMSVKQEFLYTVDRKKFVKVKLEDMDTLLNFEPPKGGRWPDTQLLDEINFFLSKYYGRTGSFPQMYSLKEKLQWIESGEATKALYVEFDPEQYYFLCGYYAEPDENEMLLHDNTYSYLWVAFDDGRDIPESYQGCELTVVVQINRSKRCRDLQDESKTVQLENYLVLDLPKFENGQCVCEPAEVDDALIFLSLYEARQYSDIGYQSNKQYDIPCIELEGQMYIPIQQYVLYADGTRTDTKLKNQLGKYYDAIMAVLIDDQYSVTNARGNEQHYGVLKLEDFFALFGN